MITVDTRKKVDTITLPVPQEMRKEVEERTGKVCHDGQLTLTGICYFRATLEVTPSAITLHFEKPSKEPNSLYWTYIGTEYSIELPDGGILLYSPGDGLVLSPF